MNRALLLLKTSRPVGWVLAPLVFLAGLLYSGSYLSSLPILQLLLLSFPFCIILYGTNDIHDYKSDKINPRKKSLEGIKLNPKHQHFVKKVSFIMILLLVLSSMLTLNATNITGMTVLLFFSYAYSAPPLRLKVRPPLDSISNGIIYLFAPFVIGFSFGGSLFGIPQKLFFLTAFVVGVHAHSTIMDYSFDKKAGDKTFSVVFGKRAASFFALSVLAITLVFSNIKSQIINYYLIFCGALFLITSIFPSEKLGSLFFKFIFAASIMCAAIFLSQF